MERKFHVSESSLYGLFAPGNESAEERKGLVAGNEALVSKAASASFPRHPPPYKIIKIWESAFL